MDTKPMPKLKRHLVGEVRLLRGALAKCESERATLLEALEAFRDYWRNNPSISEGEEWLTEKADAAIAAARGVKVT